MPHASSPRSPVPEGHILHLEYPRQWQKALRAPRRRQRAQGRAQHRARGRQTASELSYTKASALLAESSWMSQQPTQQAQPNEQTWKTRAAATNQGPRGRENE